ncbi:hypothetical protein DSO57_1034307 [Entomophthora muscae]|uniref:Uncharacterized protein n=1 Tax=Entomophthora muscae TaxID=34485 RepID=A0ACC2SCU6_9FUNG|nr:hypothetical protein DSO57_1034307 [Entomophthora muscae]
MYRKFKPCGAKHGIARFHVTSAVWLFSRWNRFLSFLFEYFKLRDLIDPLHISSRGCIFQMDRMNQPESELNCSDPPAISINFAMFFGTAGWPNPSTKSQITNECH